jgi:hypothetical protein
MDSLYKGYHHKKIDHLDTKEKRADSMVRGEEKKQV